MTDRLKMSLTDSPFSKKLIYQLFLRFFKSIRVFLVFSGFNGIGQVIMMAYNLLIARWLGPEEFASFAATYATVGLCSFVITWGLDTWMLHKGAIQPTQVQKITSDVMQLKFWEGMIWLAALTLILPEMRPCHFPPVLVFISALDILIDSISNTALASFNLQQKMSKIIQTILISRGGRLISAIALIGFGQQTAIIFALGRITATFLGAIYAIWFARPEKQVLSLSQGLYCWRQAAPYGLSESLAMVYAQIDIVLLSFLRTDKLSIAYYTPAIGLINATITLLGSVYSFYLPRLSIHWVNNSEKYQRFAWRLLGGLACIGFIATIGIGFSSKWVIVFLLDTEYFNSFIPLRLLSPLLFFKAISFGFATILVASGRQKQRLYPQLLSSVVNILLNFILIPPFGIVGTSVVYVISESILTLGYGIFTLSILLKQKV